MRSSPLNKLVPAAAATLIILAVPTSALAQATRTWVSGVGDDANPCSRTAPCKTFAGAISKTAAGGEIDVLDPGGFGALTITKSITIDATGVDAGVLVSGTNGITVAAGPGDVVTLRGLDFDGLLGNGSSPGTAGLTGVAFESGTTLRLEDDDIYGFAQNGVDVTSPAASTLIISDSTIHDNGEDGLFALAPTTAGMAARVTIEDSQFENNQCGIVGALGTGAFSGTGCGTSGTGNAGSVSISSADTSSSNNVGAGIQSDGATVVNEMSGDLVTGNDTGLRALDQGVITSYGLNTVFGNITADGSPTSIVPVTGITGATGQTGPAGPAGKIELVSCRRVKKGKKKGKRTVESCSSRLVSGTVRFVVSGRIVTARLSHDGRLYADGRLRVSHGRAEGVLALRHRLTHGRYELTLWRNGRLVGRRTIVER